METFLILAVIGLICALIAYSRGRTPIGWFVLGFFVPFLALILVLVLPNLKVLEEKERRLRTENRRLRERVRKDRQVSDQRHADHQDRLGVHDSALGVDTSARALDTLEASVGLPPPLPVKQATGVWAAQWYYVSDDERQGPVSHDTLQGFFVANVISSETLIWTDEMENWIRIDEHRDLWESLRA